MRFQCGIGVGVMSPLYGEYRQQAEYSMDMADKAPTEELRADWLRLAAKWLAMIPGHEKTEQERFDSAIQNRGTRQKDSKSAH